MTYIEKAVIDGVGILSFNRPDVHNAMDDDGIDEIFRSLIWARDESAVRVVVLRGEGKSFHAGRDLGSMGVRRAGITHHDFLKFGQRNIKTLLDMGKPSVAAMKGGTLGGGAEIAMACDIRVTSTSLKFALPEVKLGLVVDQGGSALAASLIGPSKAKWLLMTGASIDGATALEWGLADFLAEPDELDATVMQIATTIAANPPRAVLAAKELVDELCADEVRAAIRREFTHQLALFGSDDYARLRTQSDEARKSGEEHG